MADNAAPDLNGHIVARVQESVLHDAGLRVSAADVRRVHLHGDGALMKATARRAIVTALEEYGFNVNG